MTDCKKSNLCLENDHADEEITRKGISKLEELGFSINNQFTTGNLQFRGSMLALTKQK